MCLLHVESALLREVTSHQQHFDKDTTGAVQVVRDKCFTKCVTAPGRSLSANEQLCLQRCVDRYGEVRSVISISHDSWLTVQHICLALFFSCQCWQGTGKSEPGKALAPGGKHTCNVV